MSRVSPHNTLFPPELLDRAAAGGGELPPRRVQAIRCAGCGTADTLTAWPSVLPDDAASAKFKRRGWRVAPNGRHLCPDCRQAARRSAPPAPSTERPDMPKMPAPVPAKASPAASAASPTDVARPAPSPAASRAIVTLYVVLEDAYDREHQGYKPGWSDERVATETGLSPTEVCARRERDFGPLKAAPSREEVRAAMAELTGAWMAMCQVLSQLAIARDQMTEAMAKVVTALEAR